MNRRLYLIFAAALGAGTLAVILTAEPPARASLTRPFIYDEEDVTRFLRERNISVGAIDTITRNSSGDELFVFPFERNTNGYKTLRITTNGVITIRSPSRRVFAQLGSDFLAWLMEDGNTVGFRGGRSIKLPPFALFDLEPSGRYFIVGEKPARTWIARVESPQNQELVAPDILGSRVFAKGRSIYICGTMNSSSSFSRPPGSAVCLLLEDDGNQFAITGRHNFEWAAGIVDVDPDPNSSRLLLWNKSDAFPTVYLFDLATKKRSRVGRATGFEFFLRQNLLGNSARKGASKGVDP